METKLCCEPPEPFLLAGSIIKEMNINKSSFYIGIGQIIGYRIGEYREGKRRYYYLLDMVQRYRERIINGKGNEKVP